MIRVESTTWLNENPGMSNESNEKSGLPEGVRLCAIIMFLAVAAGAIGAHFLPEGVNKTTWKTGVTYQLIHGLALFALAMTGNWSRKLTRIFWIAGIVCFSGSLYWLAFPEHPKFLGPITPLGGLFFLTGWATLIFAKAEKD